MNAKSTVRADILGKLLVIQETLDVLPDAATTAEFLNRALTEIPGVVNVHLRVDGEIYPPSSEISTHCLPLAASSAETNSCVGCMMGALHMTCLPVRTARHVFGTLVLLLNDEKGFAPYQSFIQNISNVVATTFETREYIRELGAARLNLESQVAERTRELTNEINVRKAAEKALASEAVNLEALLDTASDGIHILDEDGNLKQFSHSFASMLGYTSTEICGLNVAMWDAQLPKSQLVETVRALIRTPGVFQTQHRRKDGTIIDVEINAKGVNLDGKSYLYASSRDITLRKQAELALSMRERSYRTLVENIPDLVVRYNKDLCRIYVNPVWEESSGLSYETVVNKPSNSELDELNRQANIEYEAVLRKALETGTTQRREFNWINAHGKTQCVQYDVVPERDILGNVEGLLAVGHDITERRQAEIALQESELRFRTIVEQSPIGVVCSRDGVTQAVNDAFLEMFGYADASEVCGQQQVNRIAPQCRSDVERRIRLRKEGKSVERAYETTGQRKDGSQFPLYVSAKRIVLNDGPATFAFLIDLSERKEAEAVLKRLAAIVQFSADGIIGMDLDSRITNWNPGAEAIFGYSESEVLGKAAAMLAPSNRKEESRDLIQSLIQGNATVDVETRRLRKDGKQIDIAYRLSPIKDSDNRIIGVSAIARDITEKRRLERALSSLSQCNIVLIQATDEQTLLKDVCRVIVEVGGYDLARVGFPVHDSPGSVHPVTQFGIQEGNLVKTAPIWADNNNERSPVAIALSTGEPQISRNLKDIHSLSSRPNVVPDLRYEACIALPLMSSLGALGVLEIFSSESDAFDPTEVNLLRELAGYLEFGIETLRTRADRDRIALESRKHDEILRNSLEETIKAIADIIEMRDPYTSGHQRRVSELAVAIANELGLPETTIHGIELAARIHDLGKISIPSEILCKPTKLSEIEYLLLQNHAKWGFEVLKGIQFPWPIATMVLQHHERQDGSGYPQGLKGDEILLESKILSVADVVEAMMSHRPYRAALGIERALKEIQNGRGTLYDAAVVDACVRIFRDRTFPSTS